MEYNIYIWLSCGLILSILDRVLRGKNNIILYMLFGPLSAFYIFLSILFDSMDISFDNKVEYNNAEFTIFDVKGIPISQGSLLMDSKGEVYTVIIHDSIIYAESLKKKVPININNGFKVVVEQ